MPNLKRNTLSVGAGILLLILSPHCITNAAETYFDICFDRSLNIIPPEGQKKISGLGDTVILDKKGRLWLTGNATKEGYVDIICQNLSTEPVAVALTSTESPWVNITEPEPCSAWQKNVLICPAGTMTKGVFCKISEKALPNTGEGEKNVLSASINVRAVTVNKEEKKKNDRDYIQQRIDYYAPGIDLCGIMHNKTGNIIFSWVIYAGGTVDNVKIVSQIPPEDEPVSKCIAEQISLWKFPEWDKNSQISYQF